MEDLAAAADELLFDDLLCVADTKWVLAHWFIKVLPNARRLDDFTALSALVQEELGHVRAMFEVAEKLARLPERTLEHDRGPEQLHSMVLLDRPPLGWAQFVLSAYVADEAALALLESLGSPGSGLEGLAKRVGNEEGMHRLYWQGSLESLTPSERAEAQALAEVVLPEARRWLAFGADRRRAGGLDDGSGSFAARVAGVFVAASLSVPRESFVAPGAGGEDWDPRRRRPRRASFPRALFELMVPSNEMALLARRPRRAQSKDQLMPAQTRRA